MRYLFTAVVLVLWITVWLPLEAHELVDIRSVNSQIQLDEENLGKCLFVVKDVALRLSRVQKDLEKDCIGLCILRAYYPRSDVARLEDHHDFDNDICDRFGHQRGTAVDVKLIYQNGCPLEMPSAYGEKLHTAGHPMSLPAHVYHNNYRLEEAMQRHGFVRLKEDEWWHFDFKFWRNYPVLDVPVECGCGKCNAVDDL